MGLSLEFYVGDNKRICKAVQSLDFDELDYVTVVTMNADFSLHLEANDLDHLSRVIAQVSGARTKLLRTCLRPWFDDVDRGVLEVDSKWVKMVAAVETSQVTTITAEWALAMRKAYRDESIKPNPDMKTAIRDLVRLCKHAIASDSTVLHVWML